MTAHDTSTLKVRVIRYRQYGTHRYGVTYQDNRGNWWTKGETSDYMTREHARAVAARMRAEAGLK